MITPNIIAFAAVAAWPLVVWQLYQRMDAGRALIWTVLGAYMILPPLTVFDLPMVPDMDKDTLPTLAAAVITALLLQRKLGVMPQSWIGRILMALFLIAPFFTVLTNATPIPIRDAPDIPGMRIYDSLATIATQVLYILPMILARRDLATVAALRQLLLALVAVGLVYSIPMLFESRLSPQLNRWIYGYFQHDFSQTMRFGGFRPVVFMPHGLWIAFFTLMTLLAAAAFLREGPAEKRPKQLLTLLWLGFMLYLCKSFGPAAYAMTGIVLILLFPTRLQILAAAVLAAIVIAYPLLRGTHQVPIWDILDFVRGLNGERAWSLEYRLINEEKLLARAAEQPWFGWGGYARNLEHDPITGRMLTVPDGAWIIRIGSYGWLGYISQFGLLCLPLWLLAREGMRRGAQIAPEVGVVALILAFNLADLLPNATLVPLTWLVAGALLGQAEALALARRQAKAAASPALSPKERGRTLI